MEALLARASEASLAYDEAKDFHRVTAEAEYRDEATDPLYKKGQACFLPPAPYPYPRATSSRLLRSTVLARGSSASAGAAALLERLVLLCSRSAFGANCTKSSTRPMS